MKRLRRISIFLFMISVTVFGLFWYREKIQKDQTGPEFQGEREALMISVKDDDTALLNGIKAIDAKDGDVTDSIIVEAISPFTGTGRRIIDYVAFDSDNHVTHTKRDLIYTDYTPPRFSMSGPMEFPLNATNLLEKVRAEDCIDGDITRSIKLMSEDEIDTSHVGEYNARLKVSNSAGGVSYLPVIIEVYDSSVRYKRPQLQLTDYLVYVSKGEDFDEEDYLDQVTIGSTEYTFVEDNGIYGALYVPADETEKTINYNYVSIDSDVDTDVTGYYVVDYSIDDTVYGTGTGTSRLYVVVTEGGTD